MRDFSHFPVTNGVITFLAAPTDYDVNFDSPKQRVGANLYLLVAFGTFFTLLFMYQRLYTHIRLGGGLVVEDLLLVISWMCSTVVQVVAIWMTAMGALGVHAWEQPIERFELYRIGVYIAASIFIPGTSLAKIALLLFYLRLSPQWWFRASVYATITLISTASPAIFLAFLFACKPVQLSWRVDLHGDCIDTTALFIATCVVNSLSDVLIFILPIPMVMGLKMPLIQKLGLIALFSIGLVTIITSIFRAVILPQLSNPDQSWYTAPANLWSIAEANLTIICATIPTLKRFLRHVFPKMIGSSWDSNQNIAAPRFTPSNIGTIGGSYMNRYAEFGNNEHSHELNEWNGNNKTASRGVTETLVETDETQRKSDDDTSQKVIVTTTTVIVERE